MARRIQGELENFRTIAMTQFIIFLIIGVVGIIAGYYLAVLRKVRVSGSTSVRSQEREKNLATLREKFSSGKDKKITNDEVEKLLGVSDATATRYLEALEQEGVIVQVGKEGRHVYYESK